MLKAADSAPASATVWESQSCCCGQELGVQNYYHAGVMKERAASQKQLLLSPDSHHRKRRSGSQPGFSSGHFPSLVAGADRH